MSKKISFTKKCNKIGDDLYRQYKIENKRDCGDLMLEWVKSRFWGLHIKDHLKTFNQTWNILNAHENIGKTNSYVHGDADYSVWIEPVKNSEDKKVIVSTCHCSCADDNTFLYILSGIEMNKQYNFGLTFKCKTAWPRQTKKNSCWEGKKDINFPSINTYRKQDFNFSADKGSVFTYTDLGNEPQAKKAHWHETRISPALRDLRHSLAMLKDYEGNKCQ